jgi:hypothetical protein
MRSIIIATLLLSSSAFAQDGNVAQPKCEPIGRTSKGDLVYSMECRNIPGLPPGTNGYNPIPSTVVRTIPIKPEAPESK